MEAICNSTPRKTKMSAPTRFGKFRWMVRTTSVAARRPKCRVLRPLDGRREISRLPVEQPDLGPPARGRLSSLRTQAHSIDFQPAVLNLAASQQRREETVCDRRATPRGTDALRCEVRPIFTFFRGYLCGIFCRLEGWPV